MSDRLDQYFISICYAIAGNSKCLSRQLGAIIVRDKSIISTGYNGPPRNIPHCNPCPRKELGYKSGEGLHLCPATHAEVNAITNAARLGVSVINSTLYLNTVTPCKNCAGHIVNAGIVEVVTSSIDDYDNLGRWILETAGVRLRSV